VFAEAAYLFSILRLIGFASIAAGIIKSLAEAFQQGAEHEETTNDSKKDPN
jgi:hypothetical protein